jgi:hypothetical protein
MVCSENGVLGIGDNYTVSGGAAGHIYSNAGLIANYGATNITFANSPAYSQAFAITAIHGSRIIYSGLTFTNGLTVTGKRFSIDGGEIRVGNVDQNYFPGNSAGTVINNGEYFGSQIVQDGAPFDALAYNGMQVNGGMEVSQEYGTAGTTITAGGTLKYLLDSAIVSKDGASVWTAQQVASVFPGYNSELKLTVTTAQTPLASYFQLRFMIEGYRFARAGWGTTAGVPVTIGFWMKSSTTSTGEFLVQLFDGVANSVNSTYTFTAGVAKWQTATFMPPPAWVGNTTNGVGAMVMFYLMGNGHNVAATVGNTFEITGLVVLPGAEVPQAARAPLLMRPYDRELVLCRRQYSRLRLPNSNFVLGGMNLNTTLGLFVMQYPVEMRGPPSITISAPADYIILQSGAAQALTAFTATPTTDRSRFDCTVAAGLAAGQASILQASTANATMTFDARL